MTDATPLTNEAAKLLADLRATLQQSGAFIASQAPPLAQEIILQGRIRWTFWLSLGLVLATYGCGMAKRRFQTTGLWDAERDNLRPAALYIPIGTIGIIMAFSSFRLFVMSWFAPRLYVLEKASELIRSCDDLSR